MSETHNEFASRLRQATADLRVEIRSLNPNEMERILGPLAELVRDTEELAELDRVRAELENKIIAPIKRAKITGIWIATLFGVFGVIGVLVSLYSGSELSHSLGQMGTYVARFGEQVEEMDKQLQETATEFRQILATEFTEQRSPDSPSMSAGPGEFPIDSSLVLRPTEVLERAMETRNYHQARSVAMQVIRGYYGIDMKVLAVSAIVLTGGTEAGELIVETWDKYKSDMPPGVAGYLASNAVEYYTGANIPNQGENILTEIASYVEHHPDSTSEDMAYVWSELGRLLSEYDLESAKQFELKAVELAPSDPSYHYSLSITLELLGDISAAIESAENALSMQGKEKEADYYSQAIDVHLAKLENSDNYDAASISESTDRLHELIGELRNLDRVLLHLKIRDSDRLRNLANE